MRLMFGPLLMAALFSLTYPSLRSEGAPVSPEFSKLQAFLGAPSAKLGEEAAGLEPEFVLAALDAAMPYRTVPEQASGKVVLGDDYYLYDLPEGYASDLAWPLIISLHGNPPRHCERVHHKYWRKEPSARGFILVSPNLDGGRWHRGEGERVLLKALRDAVTRFHVDWSAIYLSGYSAGGSGTWTWGTRYADLFAAIVVRCGIRKVSNRELKNLAGKGVFLIHAARDSKCPVKQAREAARLMERYGIEHRYKEFPGEHDFYWDANQEIMDFLSGFNNPAPKSFKLFSRFNKAPRMVHFVSLAGMEHQVEGAVAGNAVSVTVSNLGDLDRLDLFFNDGMVDPGKPLTVTVNGKSVQVRARPSGRAFVEGWLLYPFFRKEDRSRVFTSGCTVVREGKFLDSPELF